MALMKIVSLSTKLPRAKDTAALSGGGLKRFVKSVGDTMFQLTTKMSESDQVMLMKVISRNCIHIITQRALHLLSLINIVEKNTSMRVVHYSMSRAG